MKTKTKKWLNGLAIGAFAVLTTVALGACGGDSTQNSTPNTSTSETGVTISKESLGLDVFEQYDLDVDGAATVAWTSENEGVATVNADGIVTGVAEGTTNIVATVDGKTLKCEVTVRASQDVPTIVLNENSVELLTEDEYTLAPKVLYKQNEYDAEFSFASRNEEVATVDQNGKITAVAIGTVEIEISANWGTYVNSIYLKTLIDVNVKENVTLYIDSEAVSLSVGGSKQLTAVAQLNGKAVTDTLVWTSSDSDVIAVDSTGLVTAGTKFGTAGITVSYTTEHTTYTSDPVYVTLEKPAYDLTGETYFDYDLSKQLPLSFDSIDGVDGTVEKVTLDDVDITGDMLEGKIAYSTASKYALGEHVMQVETDNGVYTLTFTVAHYVITDSASMDAWYTEVNAIAKGGKPLYVVVANDFTYTGAGFAVWPSLNGYGVQTGVFDGRGHVIKGIKTGYTMFSTIQGTIKNIAFVDGTYNGNGKNYGALARWIDNGTLENVYMSGGVIGNVQDVISGGVSHDYNAPSVMNCIFNIAFAGENAAFYNDGGDREAAQTTFTNVYVISDKKTSVNKNGDSTGVYPTASAEFFTTVAQNIQDSPFSVQNNQLYFGETLLIAFIEGEELDPIDYDLSKKAALTLDVEGTIEQVTLGGFDITSDVVGGAISYENMLSYNLRGAQAFGIRTTTNAYSGELTIADYVISDTASWDTWYSVIAGTARNAQQDLYVVVASDFTYTGAGCTVHPSGDFKGALKGTFDGRGHVITGMKIGAYTLFSSIDGTIKNIAFKELTSNGTYSEHGLLARYTWAGTLENVYISGTATGGITDIIGKNWGTRAATVKNCIFNVTLSGAGNMFFNTGSGPETFENVYAITTTKTSIANGVTGGIYASANAEFFTAVATMQNTPFSVVDNALYFNGVKVL